MKEFSFGILCYNQERFIVEHLESIKYQIDNFGKDYQVNLVISDDCSTDNTIVIAKKWLDKNSGLFNCVDIIVSKINQGIVGNFIQLVSNIKTTNFKTLAGDDIYYKNNIFKASEDADVTVTLPVRFNVKGVIVPVENYEFKKILFSNNPKKFIKERLQYSNPLDAPGVFYSKKLLTQKLFEILKDYTWTEDTPMWNYMFNLEESSVVASTKVFVMYRMDFGISSNTGHSCRKGYLEDCNKINNEIHTKRKSYMKFFYKIKQSILKRGIEYYYKERNERLICFYDELSSIEREGNIYLDEIKIRADLFMSEIE